MAGGRFKSGAKRFLVLEDHSSTVSETHYRGKEAKRTNGEETLGGLRGQQLGRLMGGRGGAVLRESATQLLLPSLNTGQLAPGRNPRATALFCWERGRERMKTTGPSDPRGVVRLGLPEQGHSNHREPAHRSHHSLPRPGRPWRGRFIVRPADALPAVGRPLSERLGSRVTRAGESAPRVMSLFGKAAS